MKIVGNFKKSHHRGNMDYNCRVPFRCRQTYSEAIIEL